VAVFIQEQRFYQRAIPVNGTLESSQGRHLVITYQDRAGLKHRFELKNRGSTRPAQTIPLLYDPQDPGNARVEGLRGAGSFVLMLACVLSLLHLPCYEFRLRRWARSNDCMLEVVRPVFAWNNPFDLGSAPSLDAPRSLFRDRRRFTTFDVEVTTIRGNRRRAWVQFGYAKIETMWERDEERLIDILESRRAARPRILTPLERAAQSKD